MIRYRIPVITYHSIKLSNPITLILSIILRNLKAALSLLSSTIVAIAIKSNGMIMTMYISAIESTIVESVKVNNMGIRFPTPCIIMDSINEPVTANGFNPIPSKMDEMFEGYKNVVKIMTRITGIKYTIPTISTLKPEINMFLHLLKGGSFIIPVCDDFIILKEYPYTTKTSINPNITKSPVSMLF